MLPLDIELEGECLFENRINDLRIPQHIGEALTLQLSARQPEQGFGRLIDTHYPQPSIQEHNTGGKQIEAAVVSRAHDGAASGTI
jgi:hypothetical protein